MKHLFLLALGLWPALAGWAQTTTAPRPAVYNVRAFGARGDGKALDSPAINRAIAAAARAGGGTLQLPAGTYLCGSIRLQSNIQLDVGAGATILGAPQALHAYDPAEAFAGTAYQDGGHTYFHNSLLWGENLVNVSITGRGRIDGGGLTMLDKEHLGNPTGGSIGLGDKALALKRCRNVLIRDVTMTRGGHFAVLLTGCDLVTLDNLTIDTNRDGIDLDCCTNTMVSNCRVNSPHDDAICPKSSYALGRPQLTENLLITNCAVSGFEEGTLLDGRRIPAKVGWSSGRIKFGTESNGGFRNCVVSNCTFDSCNGLALEEVDGGTLENISVSNLTMRNVSHYPIYIALGSRNRGPAGTPTGAVRNVSIANVVATMRDSLSGIQLTGVPGHPLEGIRLANIRVVYTGGGAAAQAQRPFPELASLETQYPEPHLLGPTPAYGLYARHVRDLELLNIAFELRRPDGRPSIVAEDVDELDIDHFRAPAATGPEAARLAGVKTLRVQNAPGLVAGAK
ncbi:glycoside hydrolase family 28 protein [Hymenobacter caeli]|uniref:Polygalacturonase n=1 Tax=Hymenobacter caeli TaxID=2735894 RepID=A0ABX2FWB0_9BACT|nr:glycosyl hydrolase family 28 protein [Hymenobacter caeli]NRT21262.1 polygalacturonase [Hymenobacter caeli]